MIDVTASIAGEAPQRRSHSAPALAIGSNGRLSGLRCTEPTVALPTRTHWACQHRPISRQINDNPTVAPGSRKRPFPASATSQLTAQTKHRYSAVVDACCDGKRGAAATARPGGIKPTRPHREYTGVINDRGA